ncbi:unnamed protein product [Ectocarpus fasciculatus]
MGQRKESGSGGGGSASFLSCTRKPSLACSGRDRWPPVTIAAAAVAAVPLPLLPPLLSPPRDG